MDPITTTDAIVADTTVVATPEVVEETSAPTEETPAIPAE